MVTVNVYVLSLVIALGFTVLIIGITYLFNTDSKQLIKNTKENEKGLNIITKILLGTAVLLIFFSFLAPLIYTGTHGGYDKILYENTGVTGDTIGGLMNPFIAIAGVIITGLAFYIQYQANQIQRDQFQEGLDIQRGQFKEQLTVQRNQFDEELESQNEQIILNQFESQFYEMLKIHKENVSEMDIEGYTFKYGEHENPAYPTKEIKIISGRKVFVAMSYELKSIFEVANLVNQKGSYNIPFDKLFYISYFIFFSGFIMFNNKNDNHIVFKVDSNFITELCKEIIEVRKQHMAGELNYKLYSGISLDFNFKPYSGHLSRLGHYYRHLFLLVKHVANEDRLSYEEKRKYLRIVRAQLSNHEQLMLFYNWYGEHGQNWEEKNEMKRLQGLGNRFFTDFRMIHNLSPDLLIKGFRLDQIFDLKYRDFKVETNRTDDYLFELLKIKSINDIN